MNEKWNVLTYRDYDFTDDSGRQVKGRTLHCYNNCIMYPFVYQLRVFKRILKAGTCICSYTDTPLLQTSPLT